VDLSTNVWASKEVGSNAEVKKEATGLGVWRSKASRVCPGLREASGTDR